MTGIKYELNLEQGCFSQVLSNDRHQIWTESWARLFLTSFIKWQASNMNWILSKVVSHKLYQMTGIKYELNLKQGCFSQALSNDRHQIWTESWARLFLTSFIKWQASNMNWILSKVVSHKLYQMTGIKYELNLKQGCFSQALSNDRHQIWTESWARLFLTSFIKWQASNMNWILSSGVGWLKYDFSVSGKREHPSTVAVDWFA